MKLPRLLESAFARRCSRTVQPIAAGLSRPTMTSSFEPAQVVLEPADRGLGDKHRMAIMNFQSVFQTAPFSRNQVKPGCLTPSKKTPFSFGWPLSHQLSYGPSYCPFDMAADSRRTPSAVHSRIWPSGTPRLKLASEKSRPFLCHRRLQPSTLPSISANSDSSSPDGKCVRIILRLPKFLLTVNHGRTIPEDHLSQTRSRASVQPLRSHRSTTRQGEQRCTLRELSRRS
jgi:hypothetical protein